MNRYGSLAAAFAAFALAVGSVPATAQQTPPSPIERLAWLGGAWGSGDAEGAWVEEHWTAPRGGLMLGTNRSGTASRAEAFEFLRIEAGEDGVPVYWAAPAGGTPVPFRLVAAEPGLAVFENPAHDYPTRITYRRTNDTLVATIEGAGGANAMSWTWRKLGAP